MKKISLSVLAATIISFCLPPSAANAAKSKKPEGAAKITQDMIPGTYTVVTPAQHHEYATVVNIVTLKAGGEAKFDQVIMPAEATHEPMALVCTGSFSFDEATQVLLNKVSCAGQTYEQTINLQNVDIQASKQGFVKTTGTSTLFGVEDKEVDVQFMKNN